MTLNCTLSEIMTTKVISLSPKDVMTEVDRIFRQNNIHHIPVTDAEGKVVGIVSKTDFFKVQHGLTLFKAQNLEVLNESMLRSLLVEDVMTSKVVTLQADDMLSVALGIFKENLFHAIPIVNDRQQLVGIISTQDLLNYAFGAKFL